MAQTWARRPFMVFNLRIMKSKNNTPFPHSAQMFPGYCASGDIPKSMLWISDGVISLVVQGSWVPVIKIQFHVEFQFHGSLDLLDQRFWTAGLFVRMYGLFGCLVTVHISLLSSAEAARVPGLWLILGIFCKQVSLADLFLTDIW